MAIGSGLVALALLAYGLPGSDRLYNHFVWQALAFLDGRAAIDWPVPGGPGSPGNDYFQDVFPISGPNGDLTGRGLLPFPPLPAVVLLPFVAMWGLATDHRAVSVALGAIDVGLCWWALGRLAVSRSVRLAATLFFAFGTVFWYAAQLGTTWLFAHVVAVTFLLLAVGVALGGDPEADREVDAAPGRRDLVAGLGRALRAPLRLLEPRQVLAGFLFGVACTARITIAFGAPFFMLVGAGGSWPRRSFSAAVGAAIPIGALALYNLASTGHLFTPVYEYLYRLEAIGYPGLHYNPAWGLEDLRYLPQNLAIMFLSTPAFLPDQLTSAGIPVRTLCTAAGAVRGLFDPACPIAIPRDIGMGLLFTSPAYLLALPAILGARSRLVAGAALAVLGIGLVNLMHFSQGWVQFGYRFSNDFVVFAVLLVVVGVARRSGVGWLGTALIGASIAINLWGVIWGNVLGW
ncbi:MAG TPA: hypothetical protein VEX41_08035 [Candidatus Eisenbacteria bacterium]|nr:hypothetical protein [Candidatus Eisenbacteria bacterium]